MREKWERRLEWQERDNVERLRIGLRSLHLIWQAVEGHLK